ncbi:unnamed protein product [Arctia plantaginis]|uniref:CHK kinase-like domain-containing protein n=1 Tax=Arctia plantaginis TaxID=874455 RepID=A0A8S0Z1M9_ARCPL|nr:unnamed protein product [Arctia plantaginis]
MSEDFSTLVHVSPLMTTERISKALTKWFNEEHTFSHWEYVKEMDKGNAHCSDLLRIRIYGVNLNADLRFVQVVLKRIPKNIARRLTCRSDEFFRNEINFYEKILPELLAFQSKRQPKHPFDNFMKLFFAQSDGKDDVVCIEDASVKEFKNIPRQKGIDTEHYNLTLKTFARFHALSFAMKDQEPEKFEKLLNNIHEVYFDKHLCDWYLGLWNRLSDIAIDAVEKEYPDSVYVQKIREFAVPDRYQDMVKAATRTTETGVICHGDIWTCNFLYKYLDGHPVDIKMIDFQIARFATPVLDVSCIIYNCITHDLRENYYDQMLEIYYDTLANQIRDLGSDPDKLYPWKLFQTEIKKYSYFGLGYSFDSIPFLVLPEEEAIDMEIEGDKAVNLKDVWKIGNIKTKDGRLREANNVKHCVDKGYI